MCEEIEEYKCSYCGESATIETCINGVYICDKKECAVSFVNEEFERL
jgi:hypothetical protein